MLSYIEEAEVPEVRKVLEDNLGAPLPEMFGHYIAVKLYVRPEDIFTVTRPDGTTVSLFLPETVSCYDKFRNCVALVMALGPACHAVSFRIGDFIVIPRNEGLQLNYYGTVLHMLPCDKVYGVIRSPDLYQRI